MSQTLQFDTNIPVLTEIVRFDLKEPPTAAIDQGGQTAAPLALSEQDRDRLERRLVERILHQLQANIHFALEQRLDEVVQHALEGIKNEIGNNMQHMIGQIVAQTVREELSQLHDLTK